MAGTRAGFSGDTFRGAIRGVMKMATPSGTGEAITFHFTPVATVTAPHDGLGVPYDPQRSATTITPTPISTVCIVEYFAAGGEAVTPFGPVKADTVHVSVFEDEYALIKSATSVVIRGDVYRFSYEPPAAGLFDVTLHTLVYRTEAER